MPNIPFYIQSGTKYVDYFPVYFAGHHMPGTGPEQCMQCTENGCIDGIFVGYCLNCAFKYKGYRGIGFSGENMLDDYTTNKNFFTHKIMFVPPDTIVTSVKRLKTLKTLKLWKVLGVLGILGIFVGWLWWCK
jgi:hypothetical protein